MTTLCTPPAQHFAAVLGGHAGSESVGVFTFAFVGLKRPLHLLSDFKSKVLNVAKNASRFNLVLSL
jgi:hypothetical protein